MIDRDVFFFLLLCLLAILAGLYFVWMMKP